MVGKKVNVFRSWFLCIAIFIVGSVALTGCSGGSFVTTPTPTGITAAAGDSQATIAWTAVPSATSYNIYWSTTTGVTTANSTQIAGATNPYILPGLTDGTTYYFVVTAVNGNGESAPSSEVNCTPMQPVPQGVTATAGPGTGQITIAWSPVTLPASSPATDTVSYNIYESPYSGVTPLNGIKTPCATTPCTVSGLTSGTTYYFVVTDVITNSATNTSRESTASNLPSTQQPSAIAQ